MTVAQMIKKLSKMPQDVQVVIPNNDLYCNGEYIATEIENEDDFVLIDSNYKKKVYNYD